MNINRLKVFIKVAELKSFTRAAEELYMTQPATSKNIKIIEDFYGDC
ncbi:LysR family transcriptional regulator [Peptococcaceae bacterium 1198_IL3148]